jgi:hypothetical protein
MLARFVTETLAIAFVLACGTEALGYPLSSSVCLTLAAVVSVAAIRKGEPCATRGSSD